MMRSRNRRRPGFTLVELMMSAAITVLIMTILSICFQVSMSAMSAMRAQGDAADQLRAGGEVMKLDFKADRHLPAEGSTMVMNSGRRISDYRQNMPGATAPTTGFFYLDSPPGTYEGNDGLFDSTRNANCRIWMTCVRPGGTDGNLFTATVNVAGVPTVFSSEAAEVAYFLVASGQTSGSPPQQLYNLHRRQRLVAIDGVRRAQLDPWVAGFTDRISQNQAFPAEANTMASIASPAFRSPVAGPNSIFIPLVNGDDIIFSNVLSFEIKPTWDSTTPNRNPVPFNGRIGYPANHDFPFDDLTKATATTAFTFDSLAGMPVRMNAMQLRIRIYDPKVKTARQTSFIIDL